MRDLPLALVAPSLALLVAWPAVVRAEPPAIDTPPQGPLGYSLLRTADGEPVDLDFTFSNETCGVCHPRQLDELQGSMHSASHTEPLYRRFAETAREEAGEETYRYCSGCHSPLGVASGLIPKKHDPELPEMAKAGVACDVCHQVSKLTGGDGPWREPGNGSFVLEVGQVKFGHSGEIEENRAHTAEKRDFFAKSEFCASCHTVIHPIHGLRVEHTYGEWKSSVYAERGIQCQDCHMRSVEDALKVAETLKPVEVRGQSALEGPERTVFPHWFVGGNANADRLAGGPKHAEMAKKRLQTAARLELRAPERASAGEPFDVTVVVHNVAAGHNIPTGVTELRQMWVELQIVDPDGKVLFERGQLDADGELPPDTIWFGAVAGDNSDRPTHKIWEMEKFLRKRTVPPKGFLEDTLTAKLPAGLSGEVTVRARLRYRSAPPGVVAEIMKDESFAPTIVEMTTAQTDVAVK